jgi:hypothetical protein
MEVGMQSKWLGRIGLSALVMGVACSSGAMVGCAAERDPINRVQLNAIPKSFLVGTDYTDAKDDPEFYARSMLIRVPYGQSGGDSLLFTNSINSVSKIKWQIQEDKLIGRVSFERIVGTDGQGQKTTTNGAADPTKPLAQNDGLVVYEFRIESQFDIRRGYNSQTGEENNVVEENSSDRPWVQRDYVRVDFSKNMVTTAYDFDTLSLLGLYNAIDYAPLEFDIRNPEDPNAPQFDLDKGYFDVTNKLFANPKMLDLGGFIFPGCMLPNLIQGGTSPSGNCNPNELTIRHSFKKVVPTDYEPLDWDGQKFEAYGAFETEREGYARDYGTVDKLHKRYISRYNIWERAHHYTDAANMTGATACKVDDDCGGIGSVKGMSHCDQYNEKCTLPFKDRTEKPIVWHYADGSDPVYFNSNREAAEEWDTAMRGAVAVARYAECKRFTPDLDCGDVITGNFSEEEDSLYLVKEINACKRGEVPGTAPAACDALADQLGTQRGYSSAVVALAKAKPMVMLCHSPVSDKDPTECGAVGTVARLGDLRYHLVTAVATPETDSPWGIMSDSNDPQTGEHIAASINVWTHVDDLWSRSIVDTLRYISGELKTEDVTDGKYINQWVEAARQQKGGALTGLMSQEEIDKRVASVTGTTVEKMNAASTKTLANRKVTNGQQAQLEKALIANLKKISQTKGSLDAASVNAPLYQARMNLAKGTPIEAAIATPAMQQLASAGYGSVALDPATKVAATSIFQGLNPQMRRAFEQRKEANLAARGACIMNYEATAPLGYAALGDLIQEKFGKFNPADPAAAQAERADKMKDYLRRRVHYAVVAHEMGHSIALRHNFVSSSDAWNFRPQYWLLRTNAKKLSSTPCKADGTSDGATCVGPRWQDPVSQNESKNLVELWAHSSTMEYPGEPTQDLLALGAYDFGAARMFYGQAATVYTDSRFKNTGDAGTIAEAHQDEFGGLLGYRYGDFSAPIHYSGLDGAVNLIEKCTAVDAQSFKPVNWDDAKDGQWNNVIDGHIVTDEAGKPTRCTQPKVDFVQWDTLKDTDSKTHAHDGGGRVRVPHGFASDNWADLGNIAVYRHDNGADIYETMQFWIAQQEVNHIFTNYRRGRREFSIYGAFNRSLSRYHEKMRDSAKAIGLYVTLARDTVTQYNSGDDPNAFTASILKQIAVDNTVASSIAFDHFAHVFSRPEPGDHGKLGTGDDVLRSVDGTGFANPPSRVALSVPNGVTGGFGTISLGGRPIENQLASDQGRDYNSEFTLNCGSYYEKAFTAMLFTESADNFISASRDDFVDPRFRSVSIADVFPDGYRRWIANNLTNDDAIKGVYARGTGGTGPQPADLDPNGFALLGQTSWWPTQGIETCFPQGEKLTCRDPFATTPVGTATGTGPVIDPQVGWEQQKFAMLFSLIYLPENGRLNWVDQMDIWQTNAPDLTNFENRIEFHNPDGHIYVAKTFGTEVLYGKTVQKGVGARVIEYANELLQKGVVTAPILNKTGQTIGYLPVLGANGKPQYKNAAGAVITDPNATCQMSKDCTKMQNYAAVPKLLDEALSQLGWTRHVGDLKGVY